MNRWRQLIYTLCVMILVGLATASYFIYHERQLILEQEERRLMSSASAEERVSLRSLSDAEESSNSGSNGQMDMHSEPQDIVAAPQNTIQDSIQDLIQDPIQEPELFQGFVPVLMYHSFSEELSANAIVHPREFREQLAYLQEQGYTSISIYDLVRAVYLAEELPSKPVLITIDDGYADNYEYAFPILQELQMQATLNVVTSQRGETPADREHFSWEQAGEMVASGLVSIQSHTHDLHYKVQTAQGLQSAVTGLQLKQDGRSETQEEHRGRIYQDLKLSKERIEEMLRQPVVAFAYPFGVYTPEVIEVARSLGYLLMFTIEPGVFQLQDSPYTIPRINVPGGMTGVELEAEILRLAGEVE